MAAEKLHKTNQALLAPVMNKILELHANGRTWKEVCQYLEESGVVSSSGLPFTPPALRTYFSNHTRPKDQTPLTVENELRLALKDEHNARIAAEFQQDRLAKMMAEYLIARIQWTRGILATGRRDVGFEYINYHPRSRELREWIAAVSPGTAEIADRAGELVTLLCFDLAAEPNMHISANELTQIQISDEENLRRHVGEQYRADNYRWELSMAAATPLWP